MSHRVDETPTGRIVARCTQDIRAVDGPMAEAVVAVTEAGLILLTTFPSVGSFQCSDFSIRAYGAQVHFKTESLARINHYMRIARTSYNLLGANFTSALAFYLVYGRPIGAGNMAIEIFCGSLDLSTSLKCKVIGEKPHDVLMMQTFFYSPSSRVPLAGTIWQVFDFWILNYLYCVIIFGVASLMLQRVYVSHP